MGSGGGCNPKNCSKVAKDIIQVAQWGCGIPVLGSCATSSYRSLRMIEGNHINLYIDIIEETNNCTAILEKVDNKPYRLCKVMADLVEGEIKAYTPPIPIIPESRKRYALRSLAPEDNFDIVTGGDDFDVDNTPESLATLTAAEILVGMGPGGPDRRDPTGVAGTTGTTAMDDNNEEEEVPAKKKRIGHKQKFVDIISGLAQSYRYPYLALKLATRKARAGFILAHLISCCVDKKELKKEGMS